jgi:lipid A disaccharide synthetase
MGRVFITVAEVSGVRHAAQLVRSLRELDPTLIIEGLGGPEMAAAGATIHCNTVEKAAMGWRGALRAFEIYKLLKWTSRYFQQNRPDLLIGVDSPSMNFHFEKIAREQGIPTLQYVAPQLWAWATWRMEKLRKWVDQVACILPFEEEYFRSHGVNATFTGHPLFDELPPDRYALRPGELNGRPPVVGLLAGSRKSEAQHNFPRMLKVADRLRKEFVGIRFLVPTTAATHPVVERLLSSRRPNQVPLTPSPGTSGEGRGGGFAEPASPQNPLPNPPSEYRGREQEHGVAGALPGGISASENSSAGEGAGGSSPFDVARDSFDRMVPRCDLCITVSGTATLQVASFGVPMIVVYRVNPVAWHTIGRHLVPSRTFALVNVLSSRSGLGEPPSGHIVPEFVPWIGSPDRVADLAIQLLRDPRQLAEQSERLGNLIHTLDKPGASINVARLAMEMMSITPAMGQMLRSTSA